MAKAKKKREMTKKKPAATKRAAKKPAARKSAAKKKVAIKRPARARAPRASERPRDDAWRKLVERAVLQNEPGTEKKTQ